jgi:hypothetical protein
MRAEGQAQTRATRTGGTGDRAWGVRRSFPTPSSSRWIGSAKCCGRITMASASCSPPIAVIGFLLGAELRPPQHLPFRVFCGPNCFPGAAGTFSTRPTPCCCKPYLPVDPLFALRSFVAQIPSVPSNSKKCFHRVHRVHGGFGVTTSPVPSCPLMRYYYYLLSRGPPVEGGVVVLSIAAVQIGDSRLPGSNQRLLLFHNTMGRIAHFEPDSVLGDLRASVDLFAVRLSCGSAASGAARLLRSSATPANGKSSPDLSPISPSFPRSST